MTQYKNIQAKVCISGSELQISDQAVDLCLMATVVHILVHEQLYRDTMREIKRVLKPGGSIAVVEFHKIDGPPGPPLSWRHSPVELEKLFISSGFKLMKTEEVGPYNYLSLFSFKR